MKNANQKTNIALTAILQIILIGNVLAQAPDFRNLSSLSGSNYYQIKEQTDNWLSLQTPTTLSQSGFSQKSYARWQWLWHNRVDGINGTHGSFNYVPSLSQDLFNQPIVACANGDWTQLGIQELPTQNNGIIVSLAAIKDPNTSNQVKTLYAGSNTAGLWVTNNPNDASPQWHCITESLGVPAMGVQDVQVIENPSNPGTPKTILIATGQRGFYGLGVMRSIDNGATWAQTSGITFDNGVVNKMVVDYSNTDIIYAITNEHVYKSIDEGLTWTEKWTYIPRVNIYLSKSYLVDIDLDPVNPAIVYVSSNGTGGGTGTDYATIWMSTTGFATTPVDITPTQASNSGTLNQAERIATDVSLAAPGQVFVIYHNYSGTNYFQTGTVNVSAVLWSTPVSIGTDIGFWKAELAVSDLDVNQVLVGGTHMFKKMPNGSFSSYGNQLHDDMRELIKVNYGIQETFFTGDDGGVSRLDNFSSTSWANLNGQGLDITQFYGLDASIGFPFLKAVGGTQDNSFFEKNITQWTNYVYGDGYDCIADENHPGIMYGLANVGSNEILKFSGFNIQSPSSLLPDINESANAWRPISMFDGKLYVGYHNLYKSNTPTIAWQNVSQFATTMPVPCFPVDATIQSFDIAPFTNDKEIVIAFSGPTFAHVDYCAPNPPQDFDCSHQTGRLFITTNGDATTPTWIDVTGNICINNYNPVMDVPISDVLINPVNNQEIWVTFGGVSNGTGQYRVIHSTNRGLTWSDYSQGLPKFPVNSIIYQNGTNNLLYIGTDAGVFYRSTTDAQWQCFNHGLPKVIVTDLKILPCENVLRIATYGRGIWESPLVIPATSGTVVAPEIILHSLSSCDPNNVFAVNPITGYTYTWWVENANGEKILFATGSSVTFNLPNYESCTITVNAASAFGCETASVSTYACCEGSTVNGHNETYFDITASALLAQSQFTTGNAIRTNYTLAPYYNIAINGTLTVDVPAFTFLNSEVLLGPNAKVEVNGARTLDVIDSYLHTCNEEYMWAGIRSNNLNSIVNIFGTSRIEDAMLGTVSQNGAKINTTGGPVFNRCYLGMQLNGYAQTYNGNCDNTYFLCVKPSTVNGTYATSTLIAPYANLVPQAGIELNNMADVTIGDFTSSAFVTKFFNLECGIKAINTNNAYPCTLNVVNCNFEKMVLGSPDAKIKEWTGVGIYVKGTADNPYNFSAGGLTLPLRNSFLTTRYGISTNVNVNAVIRGNSFAHSSIHDVFVNKSRYENTVDILGNTITYYNTGIRCYDIRSSNVNIQSNDFDYALQNAHGNFIGNAINAQNPVKKAANLTIRQNTCLRTRLGIVVTNIPETKITNVNYISFNLANGAVVNPAYPYIGIWLTNSPNSIVDSLNYVYRNANGNTPTPVVDVDNVFGIKVDNCNYTLVQDNHLMRVGTGIRLYNQCLFTELKCNEMNNCVYGTNNDLAKGSNQGSLTDAWKNTWTNWNNNSMLHLRQTGNAIAPPFNWFNFGTQNTIASFVNNESPFRWDFTNVVHIAMAQHAPNFYCINPNPLLKDTGEIKDLIEAAAQDTVIYFDYQQEMEYYAKEFAYELISKDSTLNLDSLYAAFYLELQQGNIGKFDEVLKDVLHNNLQAAKLKNNAIADENTIEYNRKKVNEAFITAEEADTVFNPTDTLVLINIARQLALTGGDAVYDARPMLFMEVHDRVVSSLRKAQEEKFHDQLLKNMVDAVRMFPNPATDKLTIEYDITNDCTLLLVLTDLAGKNVLSLQLNSAYTSADVSLHDIQQGMYLISLFMNVKEARHEKICVIK